MLRAGFLLCGKEKGGEKEEGEVENERMSLFCLLMERFSFYGLVKPLGMESLA